MKNKPLNLSVVVYACAMYECNEYFYKKKKREKNSIYMWIYVSGDVDFIYSIKAKIEKYTKSAMPSLGE